MIPEKYRIPDPTVSLSSFDHSVDHVTWSRDSLLFESRLPARGLVTSPGACVSRLGLLNLGMPHSLRVSFTSALALLLLCQHWALGLTSLSTI